ncbi:MAG: hypothetical protein KGZ73_13810 [Rhizobiales bacterium]|nr:hypothetical protein [Hyphomicrobiales bacterium]
MYVAFATLLFALAFATGQASAQRGGEITVTISPGPEIKAELPYYTASGDLRLHFNNTTSRHAKIVSMELLFADLLERGTNCENFFGNTIGAVVRKYDLANFEVPSAKQVSTATKMLPFDGHIDNGRVEPAFHDERTKRYGFIACYKFVFENDGLQLEVYQLAGRWTFDRKSGKLLSKKIEPKAELLPR